MKPVPVKNGVDRKKAAAAARAAAQRKKLIVALCLLAVMGVMWVRMFVGKSKPSAAVAAVEMNNTAVVSATSEKVVFIELPAIEGRHNVLANDFFEAKFLNDPVPSEAMSGDLRVSEGQVQGSGITAAAEAIELIAIAKDTKPQAFIEDKLVEEGQSFKFVFHEQGYEFKVVKIYDDKVELECNGVKVTKRMPEQSFKSEQ